MVANKDDGRNLLSSLHRHDFTVSMEDQYCRRQGRTLKRGKGTSEESFKLGHFWELEKMATF
jgi:hypothetical protein